MQKWNNLNQSLHLDTVTKLTSLINIINTISMHVSSVTTSYKISKSRVARVLFLRAYNNTTLTANHCPSHIRTLISSARVRRACVFTCISVSSLLVMAGSNLCVRVQVRAAVDSTMPVSRRVCVRAVETIVFVGALPPDAWRVDEPKRLYVIVQTRTQTAGNNDDDDVDGDGGDDDDDEILAITMHICESSFVASSRRRRTCCWCVRWLSTSSSSTSFACRQLGAACSLSSSFRLICIIITKQSHDLRAQALEFGYYSRLCCGLGATHFILAHIALGSGDDDVQMDDCYSFYTFHFHFSAILFKKNSFIHARFTTLSRIIVKSCDQKCVLHVLKYSEHCRWDATSTCW